MGDRKNEEEQEEIEYESQGTELVLVAFTNFTARDGWENYQVGKFSVMAISEAFEIKNTSLFEDDLNEHIIKLKTKTEYLFAIAISGSPMSLLNEKKNSSSITR